MKICFSVFALVVALTATSVMAAPAQACGTNGCVKSSQP